MLRVELRIPFCDLSAALASRGAATEAALLRVVRSGRYVLGPEVASFEEEWAGFNEAAYAIGVGSGTAALSLILRGAGIGQGDEVIVPAYTAPATWMAVALTGARPVGADVDSRTGLVDPRAVGAAISPRTAALVGVHLFGRLAPMASLRALADRDGLLLVEDASHAHGAREGELRVGAIGDATAFSFYPTKLLGALGDAGAVTTDDEQLARAVRQLRCYGQGSPPSDAVAIGPNSRLDELQAAVLRSRLAELEPALNRLRALGRRYRDALASAPELGLPQPAADGREPAWHQFVVTHRARDGLRAEMARRGVGSAVHYQPLPPRLSAFAGSGGFSAAENLSRLVLSLPFDPWLTDAQADVVCEVTGSANSSRACT